MTCKEACESSGILKSEAEILLADVLGKDRTWLISHEDESLPENIQREVFKRFERRKRGEPVAYIRGTQEFFGRTFIVDKSVLIPRPSTETLIALALDILAGKTDDLVRDADTEIVAFAQFFGETSDVKTLVDIGSGSGCIAVTLAKETPLNVIATDISPEALDVARRNAEKLQARVEFRLGKDLNPVADLSVPFFIVTNPPYIPDDAKLSRDVRDYEPATALFGGNDGADIVRRIAMQAQRHPFCRGIAMECRTEHRELCFPTAQ